jgi:hypothetical protein
MTQRTKSETIAAIRADRLFWRSLVDEVGRHRMGEPGPMGDWTFRDLAAHLAGWRNYRIAQFEAAARGEPLPAAPWPPELDDDDGINAWIHDAGAGRSLDDVLADYDSTFDRLADGLESLPEEVLADPNAFPWTDGEPVLDLDFLRHLHEEHLPSIRMWLARQ